MRRHCGWRRATAVSAVLCGIAAAQTTSLPATTRAASPMTDAGVGEWAEYRTADGSRHRYTVTAVQDRQVVIRVEIRDKTGRSLGLPTRLVIDEKDDRSVPAAELKPESTRTIESLVVGSRRFTARKTTSRYRLAGHDIELDVWISPDVPLWGVLRQQERIDGRPGDRLDLVAWGRGGPATQAAADSPRAPAPPPARGRPASRPARPGRSP